MRNKIELIIALLLLCALVVLFVWSNALLQSTGDEMNTLAQQALEAANLGDWDETNALLQQYNQTWHEKKSMIALVMEHSYIRAIDETVENTMIAGWLNDYNSLVRHLEGTNHSLEHALEVEELRWETLF
jgi:hypothetical protein